MGYRRPVWTEVDLSAIRKNVAVMRSFIEPTTLFMAVVKADAYGHGIEEVSRVVLESGADRLGVALVEEGVRLRRVGIEAPIQVLHEVPFSAAELVVDHNLIPTVCSWELVKELSRRAQERDKVVKVHVKVDTGMSRLGLSPEETPAFLERLGALKNLEVEGIFTHFALADQPEDDYTMEQFGKFENLLSELEGRRLRILLRHAANSAATIFFPKTHLDMVRIGITLYGLHPSSATKGKVSLIPALEWKTRISAMRSLAPGEGVSYGLTYRASRDTRIATLPLGYGDGYTRLFSNRSDVLVLGRRAPVVGNVCMDQCMVDIGDIPDARVGTEVVLLGRQDGEEIPADELAEILGTINYEIVCMISERVPRVYKGLPPFFEVGCEQ